jgi:hypothetical protein
MLKKKGFSFYQTHKLEENWRKTGGKRNVLVLSVSMEIQAKMKA